MLTRHDTRILLGLAIPLIASGLVEASLGFSSTIFLSHLGAHYVAAGALVGWFFATLMIIFWGLFMAVSVAISNRQGAQDDAAIAYIVRDAFYLTLLLTIPITLLLWHMAPLLIWLGQKQDLVTTAIPYLHALALGVFPDLLGLLVLQLVIGLGHARTNLAFTLSWVVLNISLNYGLIFGRCGLPKLGFAGLGWGTTISFWLSLAAWLIYLLARKQYRRHFTQLFRVKAPYYYRELITVGLPLGLMWCIEVTFFFVLFLLIGHINVTLLAASQLTMQYVGLFVSVLFSIAQAVTVRVSNRLGAEDYPAIDNALHSGLLIALTIMLSVAAIALLMPESLLRIDFDPQVRANTNLLQHATRFLRIGVLFLVLEAIRITVFGALRGLKDTISTLINSLITFWGIAIPLGFGLAYGLGLGAMGFWLGLLFSGFFGAGFLSLRYQRLRRKFM